AFAAFDPGVGIMIASNNIFQSNNYSLTGAIASLSYSSDVPYILSGNWSMSVESSNVTNFQANISELKADGFDSQKILLINFVSHNTPTANRSSSHMFTGSLDIVGSNQSKQNVPAIITIENFKAINIVLGYTAAGSLLASQPIYGTVDQPRVNST